MTSFHYIVSPCGMTNTSNNQELISVIIPTRNRSSQLIKAIDSALSQTWANIEIIVVDDASDDETSNIIPTKYSDIKYIRNTSPQGGSFARNIGIKNSNGIYIAFLDDDDTWLPEKLELQVSQFKSRDDVSLVTCSYYEINLSKKRYVRVREVNHLQDLLCQNSLGGASMYLTKKDFLLKVGCFDSSLSSGQDWDILIKMWSIGKIVSCSEPLVNYLNNPHSIRITNSIYASYKGLLGIFFKYKSLMSNSTRYFLLTELIFYRWKIYKQFKYLSIDKMIFFQFKRPIFQQSKFWLRVFYYFFVLNLFFNNKNSLK